MPLWVGEQDQLREEDTRLAEGQEPRAGIEEMYGRWRETTDPCIQDALRFYGTYLQGQVSGWSEALDLSAMEAAMRIAQVDPSEQEQLARWLLLIHADVMIVNRQRRKASGDGG